MPTLGARKDRWAVSPTWAAGCPVSTDAGTIWREYCTLDTFYGALPYSERTDLAIDSAVGTLAVQAVQAGAGREGNIGAATAWLFDARETVQAVVAWIERHF